MIGSSVGDRLEAILADEGRVLSRKPTYQFPKFPAR